MGVRKGENIRTGVELFADKGFVGYVILFHLIDLLSFNMAGRLNPALNVI